MSLCDKCRTPGACCYAFILSDGNDIARTYWVKDGDEAVLEEMQAMGLPFLPLRTERVYTDPETNEEYRTVFMQCPNLGKDGKCMDYENRPDLCREYTAGNETTCRESPTYHTGRIVRLAELLGETPAIFIDKT